MKNIHPGHRGILAPGIQGTEETEKEVTRENPLESEGNHELGNVIEIEIPVNVSNFGMVAWMMSMGAPADLKPLTILRN
jgi:ribosomal protein L24